MGIGYQHRSKYGNRAVYYGGKRFASKLEGERYLYLRSLQDSGEIADLRCQVRYRLAPTDVTYIADFVYTHKGEEVIEDTKGVLTDVFKVKANMMLRLLGKEVRIVKKATQKVDEL